MYLSRYKLLNNRWAINNMKTKETNTKVYYLKFAGDMTILESLITDKGYMAPAWQSILAVSLVCFYGGKYAS